MLPTDIQTCLSLLVKFWWLAPPVGKTSQQGNTVLHLTQEYAYCSRKKAVEGSAYLQQPTATTEKKKTKWVTVRQIMGLINCLTYTLL